jgi:hypothetical protein
LLASPDHHRSEGSGVNIIYEVTLTHKYADLRQMVKQLTDPMARSLQFPSLRTTVEVVAALLFILTFTVGVMASPVAADGSSILEQRSGNQTQPTNASVTIDKNETTQKQVVLTSVTLPDAGYIVIHGGGYNSSEPTNESIIDRTQYVRGGTFEDVVVTLNQSIANNSSVVVTLHNETNGNQTFDYIDQTGPDAAYQNQSGSPVTDRIPASSIGTNTSSESNQPANNPSKSNQSVSPPPLPKQLTLSGGYNAENQSNTYSIGVSGDIVGENTNNNSTATNKSQVKGSVPYQESRVLYYSGRITQFNTSGDIAASIGGQEVSTEPLGKNWIILSKKNNTVSAAATQYQFSVDGMIVPDANAANDTWSDDTTIKGQLGQNDSSDTYYYSGGITQSSINRSARVTINGEQVQVRPGNNTGSNNSSSTKHENPKAGFTLSNITLSEERIETGQELSVNVTISNIKNGRLKTTIGLATQGTVTDSKEITLFANGSQRVTFRREYESPGHYAVKIGVLNSSSYVVAESEVTKSVDVVQKGQLTPTPTPTPNSSSQQSSSGFGPGFGVIGGMIAVVIVVGLVLLRR